MGGADPVSKKLGKGYELLSSTVKGTTTYNIAAIYPNDYTKLSNSNIIIGLSYVYYYLNHWGSTLDNDDRTANQGSTNGNLTPTITYNATTGVLTVVCNSVSTQLGMNYGAGNGASITCTPYYNVYKIVK